MQVSPHSKHHKWHPQALLDDQIVKAQSMRASPFIKPLEARANKWEDLLVNLQVCTAQLVVWMDRVLLTLSMHLFVMICSAPSHYTPSHFTPS